jgi:hypothetical protein
MFEKLKKKMAARKKRLQKEKQENLEAAAIARIENLKDKGELINYKPEGVACSLFDKDCNSYIKCIFLTVGGQIFYQDRLLPGNRFQTKLSNGKTAIWSIITKTKEQWKWDTCHNVKGIFVGYTE